MAHLTDDHLTMPPDAPMPADNTALAQWHRDRIAEYSFQSDTRTEDIQIRGELGTERWSGPSTLVPKARGQEVIGDSKGVWIWERQPDGSWKLLWSIWNENDAA
ncbi:MAG: hypothetical protein P8188_14000 [Gemmatimonadota bacterium]